MITKKYGYRTVITQTLQDDANEGVDDAEVRITVSGSGEVLVDDDVMTSTGSDGKYEYTLKANQGQQGKPYTVTATAYVSGVQVAKNVVRLWVVADKD